jgi:DNA-binding GntR family transcriptional regulator
MARKQRASTSTGTTSIRRHAYVLIQRRIAVGELPPGSAISELDLAKELGSSRTPVREAISRLIAEGLLEQSDAGRVGVVQFNRENIIDIYELREALEMYAVAKVARQGLLRPQEKERLQQLIDVIPALKDELLKSGRKALNEEQMSRFLAADFNFHNLLISLSQNARIHKVVSETRLLMQVFSIRMQGHNVEALDRIHKQHQDLVDAIDQKDMSTTMHVICEHIQESQRERLNEFDQHRRDASIRKSIPAFFEMYQPLTLS